MEMGKALIGLFSACALLALLLLRGGETQEPLNFVQPAELGRAVEASALSAGSEMQASAPAKRERTAASGSGRLWVVHAEGLSGMQGCRLRIDGGATVRTEGDGAVSEQSWPVGSVLSCEVDVDGDGDFDEMLTHRIGGNDEPLAIGGWTAFEFEQTAANREAHPIDSVGWSKRLGTLKEVGGTRKPSDPLPGSSRPWVRIPATHLSLRSDWVVVARSRAVVDVQHMLQRYGLQVIKIHMVPLGSLRVDFAGIEPLQVQGHLTWAGAEEDAPKIPAARWGVDSDRAQWRLLPVGPYELRIASLSHQAWSGRVRVEVGKNEVPVNLMGGTTQAIACTAVVAQDELEHVKDLKVVELELSEEPGIWQRIALHQTGLDPDEGEIYFEGPAVRSGVWTVRPARWFSNHLTPASQEWSGQVLRFSYEASPGPTGASGGGKSSVRSAAARQGK